MNNNYNGYNNQRGPQNRPSGPARNPGTYNNGTYNPTPNRGQNPYSGYDRSRYQSAPGNAPDRHPRQPEPDSKQDGIFSVLGKAFTVVVLTAVLCLAALSLVLFVSSADTLNDSQTSSIDVVQNFNTGLNNLTSTALEGIKTIEKVYTIPDGAVSAPKPNKDNFGTTTDPAVIDELIAKAHKLVGSDRMVWNDHGKIYKDTIYYYYDETILVICWKEVVGTTVQNYAEIKIAHPSQFRKLFSENTYGANAQFKGSQLGKSANAVFTSNADYYGYRKIGVVVYNGETYRTTGKDIDNCFIDSKGDLNFVYADTFKTDEEVKKYVEENDIVFSLSFGPVLIRDGKPIASFDYFLGEPDSRRVRAAISQIDTLHYFLVALDCATEDGRYYGCNIVEFADHLTRLKLDNAYTIDGGQTAMFMIDDHIINRIITGSERQVTDIIYFGTALPEETE